MENQRTNLELDLKELRELHGKAARANVKKILEFEISKTESQIKKIDEQRAEVEERVKQAKVVKKSDDGDILYTMLNKYSWDESEKMVSIYLSLAGIGELDKDAISCEFTQGSFDLKIQGYKNKNHRLSMDTLAGGINAQKSKLRIKKDMIIIKIFKEVKGKWGDLKQKSKMFDKEDIKGNEDPQAGIFNMMKKMYTEGDDEMKRTIAKTWSESQKNQGMMPPTM